MDDKNVFYTMKPYWINNKIAEWQFYNINSKKEKTSNYQSQTQTHKLKNTSQWPKSLSYGLNRLL